MKRLAIIGGGDLGMQIAHHSALCGYNFVGFFDDYAVDALGNIESVRKSYEEGTYDELMVGIGYKHMSLRKEVFAEHKNHIPFATIIHPSTVMDASCRVGEGCFIYPGCTLDSNATLGDNISLNVGCIIAHDSKIGDHSMLSPGVIVSGFVAIKKEVNLGTGTCVIDNITISDKIRTGAGSVVTQDLIQKGLYVGVPAKYKKA